MGEVREEERGVREVGKEGLREKGRERRDGGREGGRESWEMGRVSDGGTGKETRKRKR